MAVRLLAGPFRIRDDKGEFPVAMTVNAYYPNVGLLGFGHYAYLASNNTHRITFDGVSQRSPKEGVLTFNNPGYSWWPSRDVMVTMYFFGGGEWMFEPKTMLSQFADAPENRWTADTPIYMHARPYVRMQEKWVMVNGARVYGARRDGPAEVEGPVWPWPLAAVRCGRVDAEVLVTGNFATDASGGFYNPELEVAVSPIYHTGMPADNLLYAPEWGILISTHDSEVLEDESPGVASPVIRIWSLEVNPQILTNPAPYIGTPKSGQIVTYRVRLTGAQDDPAEDELINWMVTGAGVLLDLQTKTDVDGYATARVQYLVGETGDSTVEASVQC